MTTHDLENRTVLVVDDDPVLRKRLQALLMQQEAEVQVAENLSAACQCLAAKDFDLVLLDIHLPDGRGLDLLKERMFPPFTSVVIMTAEGGLETALEALRNGAADYLCKPFDPFELPLVYARCRRRLEALRLHQHDQQQASARTGSFYFGRGLEGVRERMDRILEADHRVTGRPPSVLIRGETGTGKSTLARMLHAEGPRAGRPFVELNCAALSETLAESELFGHERGAFTDARETRIGLFEAAEGGSLFLDEIPSLSLGVQAKILTAIEQGEIRRVGGNHTIRVDVRLMAATLQDLEHRVTEGSFRADLFHRLNVLTIDLPPLRERPGDVLPTARHLLGPLARHYGRRGITLSAAGERRLEAYAWPGNVRELLHELERSLVLGGEGPLDFEKLAESRPVPAAGEAGWLVPDWQFPDDGFCIEEAEMTLIRLALKQAGGNVSAAARLLGTNRDFIRYRLEKHPTPM